jgi:hypothetical protein
MKVEVWDKIVREGEAITLAGEDCVIQDRDGIWYVFHKDANGALAIRDSREGAIAQATQLLEME